MDVGAWLRGLGLDQYAQASCAVDWMSGVYWRHESQRLAHF